MTEIIITWYMRKINSCLKGCPVFTLWKSEIWGLIHAIHGWAWSSPLPNCLKAEWKHANNQQKSAKGPIICDVLTICSLGHLKTSTPKNKSFKKHSMFLLPLWVCYLFLPFAPAPSDKPIGLPCHLRRNPRPHRRVLAASRWPSRPRPVQPLIFHDRSVRAG